MTVLQKLRIQVIFTTVFVLMFILAAILITLDISIYRRESDKVFDFLEILSKNEGHRPSPKKEKFRRMTPEDTPQTGMTDIVAPIYEATTPPPFYRNFEFPEIRNYFSAMADSNKTVAAIINDFPLSYTKDEISEFIAKVFRSGKHKGIIDGLFYTVTEKDFGSSLICVANRRGELTVMHRLFVYSFMIYALSLIVAVFFAWIISGYIVRPVKTAFEKQKQFVADASHELKTPIAVIGANLDVLMSDFSENKWLGYIREENDRMGHLVKDLLFLARSDSERDHDDNLEFNLSQAIGSAVLPFESVIFEEGKTLDLQIEDNMSFFGNENKIKQVVIVLVDNAIKNSDRGALIKVNAFSENQKKIVKVYNTGNGIPISEREKIFLRFYRSDSSRNRKTGGYGLGLPIANTIAQEYGGSISVDSKVGEWTEFTLSLPSKKRRGAKNNLK